MVIIECVCEVFVDGEFYVFFGSSGGVVMLDCICEFVIGEFVGGL